MALSSPTAGAMPLGQLLSESFSYYKAHIASFAVGAVVFGVITGIFGVYTAGKVQSSVSNMMGDVGVNIERMTELSARMEAGDETALAELEALIADGAGDVNPEMMKARAMSSFTTMLPFIGMAGLVSLLISFLAHAYYMLVAVEGKDVNGTLSRASSVILPLAGVSLWSFLRSFVWIPVIGWVIAIIIGPRFIAAPLLYLTEGKGVMKSVSDSYARTRNYWGKIFGNMIVVGLLMIVVSIVISLVTGMLLMAVPAAMIIVKQIVSQFMIAFASVFAVRLSQTILQHPRA